MRKILFFIIFISAIASSQELNCNVSINMDNLTNTSRDLLSDFKRAVSDYMNKTKFSSDEWQGDKISCSLNILFLSASANFSYTAQVVVSSQRPVYRSEKNTLMLSINDPTWSFTYQKGQPLYSNKNNFDPITGFLDYYANVIIGFEMESDVEFGGTPFFNKALNIVNMATVSTYSKGWGLGGSGYNRESLVEDMLSDKLRPFRQAFYQYYYGIDIFAINKKIGQEKIVYLINTIYSLRDKVDFLSIPIKTFFDARSGEITQYLSDYPDKNIFNILKKIDPSNTAKYNAALGLSE